MTRPRSRPRPGPEPDLSFTLRHQGPGPDGAGQPGRVHPKGARRAYFPETGSVEVKVYDRTTLASGCSFEGPAIVEEAESTTVVNPGDRLSVDELGNLRIRVAQP